MSLGDFVMQSAIQVQTAAASRQRAFGDDTSRRLEVNPTSLAAISFASKMVNVGPYQNPRGIVCPAGLDLTPVVERGDAVLLAWDPGHAPVNGSLNRFKTARSHRDTLLRLVVPVAQPKL